MSDKYIPKVGEGCEVLNKEVCIPTYEKCMPIFIGKHSIVYDSISCSERTAQLDACTFRPIPTKADAEREKLVEIIKMFSDLRPESIAKEIQKAGFTIPKKVKRSDVYNRLAVDGFNHESATDASIVICELLGDLVERDDE